MSAVANRKLENQHVSISHLNGSLSDCPDVWMSVVLKDGFVSRTHKNELGFLQKCTGIGRSLHCSVLTKTGRWHGCEWGLSPQGLGPVLPSPRNSRPVRGFVCLRPVAAAIANWPHMTKYRQLSWFSNCWYRNREVPTIIKEPVAVNQISVNLFGLRPCDKMDKIT